MSILHPGGNVVLSEDVDADIATEAKQLHPSNACIPMVCNAPGKATKAKLLHPKNALLPMVCNASGKATEAKLLHP